ncbi:MAG TPA: hypothetical protein VFW25_09060 [Silvibacterium sp.]|nr:hypothetical protein [Silvibacterium sp.]
MTEDEKVRLRALFACIIGMLKANGEMTVRVATELEAVTQAVRGLDPTFDDVVSHRRKDAREIGDPAIRSTLAEYDELIRRVQNGDYL